MSQRNPKAAIAKPSDLETTAPGERPAPGTAVAEDETRTIRPELPPVMALDLQGGETIELTEDQVFADRVVVRAGERGRALYPSSQAACWVVHFPRVGSKFRIIPERLLREV